MKYKNQLINVIKNTFILGINDRLLPNTYDTNLYPEDKNFKDIDNSQQRNINSDIIFDRPLNNITNSKFRNKNSMVSRFLDIQKNIDILPKKFNKILEKINIGQLSNVIEDLPSDSFEPISKTLVPSDSFEPIPESLVPSDSFEPISKNSTVPSDSFEPIPESLKIPSDSFEPIPESLVPSDSFEPIPESLKIPDILSSSEETTQILTPYTKSIPNSVENLKKISFEQKFKKGIFYPDAVEINNIKRNLFTDILGDNVSQNILNKNLQKIPAFKDGGKFASSDVNFKAIAYNEPGSRSNETHIIQPDNTPMTTISNINTNKESSIPIEMEQDISESILILSDRIKKLDRKKNDTPGPEPKFKYPPNGNRGLNNNIEIYYNYFDA